MIVVDASALIETRGRDALTDHAGMPIRRYLHVWLISAAWRLRANITAYDAMYVALAQALAAPLLTRDAKLASGPPALSSMSSWCKAADRLDLAARRSHS